MKKIIQSLTLSIALISNVTIVTAQSDKEIDLSDYNLSEKTIAYSNYSAFANQVILSLLDTTHLNVITLDGNLGIVGDPTSYEFPSEGYTVQNTIVQLTLPALDGEIRSGSKGDCFMHIPSPTSTTCFYISINTASL